MQKFQCCLLLHNAVCLLAQVHRPRTLLEILVLLTHTSSLTLPQNTGGRVQVRQFQLYPLVSTPVPVLPQVARPLPRLPEIALVLLIQTFNLTLPQNTGGRVQVAQFQLHLLMSKPVPVLPQVARPFLLLPVIVLVLLAAT